MAISPSQLADLPSRPDEIISHILAATDLKTIGRCRTLSTYWRKQLLTHDFILKHLGHAMNISVSIYLEMESILLNGGQKFFKISPSSGARQEITVPFERDIHGELHLINAENGMVAMRCFLSGKTSDLIMWNPFTTDYTHIPDFSKSIWCVSSAVYGFAYKHNSSDYVLIAIYRKNLREKHCWCTSYSSFDCRWGSPIPCPDYVQGLDKRHVVSNEILYWLNSNNNPMTNPQCIVSYCPTTTQFGHILIPNDVAAADRKLLSINGNLCLAATLANRDSYSCIIWMLKSNDGIKTWHVEMKTSGDGHTYYPELFLNREIVMLCENFMLKEGEHNRVKQIRLHAVDPQVRQSRSIQNLMLPINFFVKSLFATNDTVFLV